MRVGVREMVGGEEGVEIRVELGVGVVEIEDVVNVGGG